MLSYLALFGNLEAATFSSSATAPVIDATDRANLAARTGSDKWFFQTANEANPSDSAKGQTFTTGANPTLFQALTLKLDGTTTKGATTANPTTWTIRLGTLSGTNFTLIASETANQTANTGAGHFMTWTFDTPILLSPNTTYAVDVGMLSRTAWTTGLPYISHSGNVSTSGVGLYYDSGDLGKGGATVTTTSSRDRIFHVDLQDPVHPVPAPGSIVPAGNVSLSWANLAPTTGADVWVDIWFGTDPAAMNKVLNAAMNATSVTVSAPTAATYYWRIDTYLSGTPTGSPLQGTRFNFVVFDSDSDGLPDVYELLHTNPPSATAMNRDDDRDGDSLSNFTEFSQNTNPSLLDTDGDGLLDGSNITVTSADARYTDWVTQGINYRDSGSDRIFLGEVARGTDPQKADTDNDGLSDDIESNSGTWLNALNTGTDPLRSDTDNDSLADGVETNTGIYVSIANSGTNPLNADSDGDGSGDWYEAVIIDKNPALGSPPNSPNDANLTPNIPYPLPAPDSSTGITTKPVKVYIMSGQSNMVGFGAIGGTSQGTLQTMTASQKKFPNLVAAGGGWSTRRDVKYRGVITDIANGDLKADVAGSTFGPELGFGYAMGWYHDEPVLLIKASQGNRGLMWDFLPPGSTRTISGATTYPAYGESPETWPTATGAPTPFGWYAGKQYDDCFLKEPDMAPRTPWAIGTAFPNACQIKYNGVNYVSKSAHTAATTSEPGIGATWTTFWSVYSVFNTADVLDQFATEYPSWAAQGFEVAGYVWWQGYDDTSADRSNRYQANMAQFIKQIRLYYENRYPGKVVQNAPFVIATLAADGGWGQTAAGYARVAQAQLNVDGSKGIYPEFSGNVKTMEARGFWRDSSVSPQGQGFHYNHNAETYLLVGDALGRAMIDLNSASTAVSPYQTWANSTFDTALTNPTSSIDFDQGGLETGIEWVLGGDPTRGSDDTSIAPTIDRTTDPNGKLLFIFRRDANAKNDSNTSISVEYGSSLNGWTTAVHQGTAANQITITEQNNGFATGVDRVTVGLPANLSANGKIFVRLKVSVRTP